MSAAPQRCPRCWASRIQLPLQHGRTGTFDLHACAQCGGVWLGPDAAHKVLAETDHAPSGQPPSLFCPCCNGGMTPLLVRPSGVVVDRCDADGVWFDAQELDAICAQAARRKGVRMPARAAAVVGGVGVVAAAAAGAAAAFAVADAAEPSPSGRGNTALDVALEMPETVYFGAEALGGAVSDAADVTGVAEVAGDALEGATGLAEGAVEAGSTVLETLGELLGALFD